MWINRVRLPILLVVDSTGKMNVSLGPFAPEDLISPSRPASPCSFSTLRVRLNVVLTHGISFAFRGGIHLFIISPTVVGSSPEFIR